MKSIYGTHQRSYVERGYSPLPVSPGWKHPSFGGHGMKGWSKYAHGAPEEWRRVLWSKRELGICLCMGFNGLIGVDVDDMRAFQAAKEVFGELRAPVKIGRKGATAFFYDPTGKISTKVVRAKPEEEGKQGDVLIEFLSFGRSSTIPPTVHPQAQRPYRWHNGSLEDLTPTQLPIITAEHISQTMEVLKPYLPKLTEMSVITASVKPNIIDIDVHQRRRYEGYAHAALRRTIESLANHTKGGRNAALFNAACSLAWTLSAGIVPRETLKTKLIEACMENGLIQANGLRDALSTIERGFAKAANDGLPVLKERAR